MSTQSVKTKSWNDLTLVRHARPYRMAVIELIGTGSGALTYRYVFNEFGLPIITASATSNTGVYNLTINSTLFNNTNNLTSNVSATYNATLVAGVPGQTQVTGSFITNTPSYGLFKLSSYGLVTANSYYDFVGKIMLVFKEYYG